MTTTTKKRIVRSLLALAAAIALFVGVVGFAHTKKGRFLLAYIPGMGACPLGKPASPEQIELARAKGLAPLRGTKPAATRAAFGFTLARSTKADVLGWARDNGIACDDDPKKLMVACRDVPASALEDGAPAIAKLSIGVDRDGRVVSLDATRRALSFDDAVNLVDREALAASRRAGGVAERRGATSGADLAGARLRRAEAEIRFTDYRFLVTAINLGEETPFVREQHQVIDDSKM